MRISDWSSDVCSSDLDTLRPQRCRQRGAALHVLDALMRQPVHDIEVQRPDAGRTQRACRAGRHLEGLYPVDRFLHVAVHVLHAETGRSEEHTSELQSLMRISYAVFCLKKNKHHHRKST